MSKYTIRVSETIYHTYEFEANSEDEAMDMLQNLSDEQLQNEDLYGEQVFDILEIVKEGNEG
jgi:hypothetical protein